MSSSNDRQTTANQIVEIKASGFDIQKHRIIEEHISGSVAAEHRPGFSKLLDRLEPGDVLVVTKLDRLGRNAIDVRTTVEALAKNGVKVHCLALGGVDLTSPAGKMTMQVIAAVAEFEKDLLIERTQAGIERAKIEGIKFGRPSVLTVAQRKEALALLDKGETVSQVARAFQTTRQTIIRLRKSDATHDQY